jgi:aldose 1-epimerase
MTQVVLQNDRAVATLDPGSGGRLASLRIDGRELLVTEPIEGADHDWHRGSFPMAPWVGVQSGGEFEFGGRRHSLVTDRLGEARHGLVAESEWRVDEQSGSRALMTAAFGPAQPAQWFADGWATQHVELTGESLRFRLEVHTAAEAMPAAAGYHPWFLRESADLGEAEVSFEPSWRLLADESGDRRPTRDLGSRPWADLFTEVASPPTITWPNGPTLALQTSAPIWVYYEQDPRGFCIEPWTAPDDSLSGPLATVVTPEAPLVLEFTMSWGETG